MTKRKAEAVITPTTGSEPRGYTRRISRSTFLRRPVGSHAIPFDRSLEGTNAISARNSPSERDSSLSDPLVVARDQLRALYLAYITRLLTRFLERWTRETVHREPAAGRRRRLAPPRPALYPRLEERQPRTAYTRLRARLVYYIKNIDMISFTSIFRDESTFQQSEINRKIIIIH